MNFYRLDHLSSHYVDDLDMQVAALEIRAQRRFQEERDLHRRSVGIATTKLQQYCLGLVLSHRGSNSAIYSLVDEAAKRSGLPVELWAMHEVKGVWDEMVMLQRVGIQVAAPAEHPEYHDAPAGPFHSSAEHPKPKAGSAPQPHDEAGASPEARFEWDEMPITGTGKAGYGVMAHTGKDQGGVPGPRKKTPIRYPSQKEPQAERRQQQKAKKETVAVQAAADKEEDARLEAEIERQMKEDAEAAERERAAAKATEDEYKAKGVLNPVQQRELDDAREMFRGNLSEDDQRILAEAKKEFGENTMEWGLAQTKNALNRILMGIHVSRAEGPETSL